MNPLLLFVCTRHTVPQIIDKKADGSFSQFDRVVHRP